jgi:hypothetical protein
MITYKTLSTVMAILASALFLFLLFAPEIIFTLFQAEGNESAFFISRRAAMLFLCIAVFSWFGRNSVHSDLRQGICLGMSISMLALAVLGVVEFTRGIVGVGIFLAVITEVALAIGYFQIWKRNRNA